MLQSFVEVLVRLVPGTADIPKDRIIPALSALYIFMTFGATGAASGAGQAMGRVGGLDDNRTSSLNLHLLCHLLHDGKDSHTYSWLISLLSQTLVKTSICSVASHYACAAPTTI